MTVELPRDRYGRPVITMPDGSTRTYVRASQLGEVLDDKTNLNAWSDRMLMSGIRQSEHVQRLLQLADPTDNRAMASIARKAKDAAGAWHASDLGTAIHRLAERLDLGEITIDDVDEQFRPSMIAYQQTLAAHGFVPKLVEQIVVCDAIETAGTLDRVFTTPAGDAVIGDIKTGKQVFLPSKSIACQLAAYAHAVMYDPETGERTPIDGLRTDIAYVVHLPANGSSCTLYEVDTSRGYQLAMIAQEVRRVRNERLIRPLAS